MQVGSINFDPSYKDSENPIVQVQYPVNVTAYRCHEDILSQGAAALIQVRIDIQTMYVTYLYIVALCSIGWLVGYVRTLSVTHASCKYMSLIMHDSQLDFNVPS